MIVIRIIGGLGNQMFQYAAARALAARRNAKLRLDLRWMRRYEHRSFLLDELPISGTPLAIMEGVPYTWWPFRRNPPFVWLKALARLGGSIYMESSLRYDSEVVNLPDNMFLAGYFQSEKYFMDLAPLIRDEFSLSPTLSIYDRSSINAVNNPCSVAVQFRRGDYVTDPATNRSIGTCPMDYYERARALICGRTKQPHFCIFSDEIQWCRENLHWPSTTFVQRIGGTAVDDLALAARCRHIILANSTFSWWSAWLNGHRDMIAIAPQRWFRDPKLNTDAADLIPPTWVRI